MTFGWREEGRAWHEIEQGRSGLGGFMNILIAVTNIVAVTKKWNLKNTQVDFSVH